MNPASDSAEPNYSRWQKAQEAEVEYWKIHRKTLPNRHYWTKILKKGFDLDFSFFLDKNVLEIGPGPSGIIYYIREAKYRIGVEPMDLSDLLNKPWKSKIVKKGVGEKLEFADSTFDIIVCFNVLDHCYDPALVLNECHRVLKKEGMLLLWVHTLRGKYGLIESVLNKIDRPHPHHFDISKLREMVVSCNFMIRQERVSGLSPALDQNQGDNFKTSVGNFMMESACLICLKN